VAALLTTFVQAVRHLALGVRSPAELIGDGLGDRVPVRHFLDLIGSDGRLKALAAGRDWGMAKIG